jgi:hypothetical protein
MRTKTATSYVILLIYETRHTITLVMLMQIVDDFTHAGMWKIFRIHRKDSALIHIV